MPALATRVIMPEPSFSIDYYSRILLMGSCFTENIGRRLEKLKFDVLHNPFGVVYNPVSLSRQVHMLLNKNSFTSQDLEFYNELWFSYSHYTLFSDPDRDICLENINKRFNWGKDFIASADAIFITLGTSFFFTLADTDEVVANCHKIPSKKFDRHFSSLENTITHLKQIIQEIRMINQGAHFVFTVSPIRHWKDGAIENQRSKSALLLAIAHLQTEIDGIFYFPVYEYFMDELRDYRYYDDDMLHPSPLAIELVWDHFSKLFFTDECGEILAEVTQVINATKHRPLHTSTKAYAKFLSGLKQKIQTLTEKHPFLDFTEEKANLDGIV